MPGHTYKIVELVGSSQEGVTQAIESAVAKASETLKGLDWFEVSQVRGEIVDGHVAWYQVALKVGFRIMTPEDLAREA